MKKTALYILAASVLAIGLASCNIFSNMIGTKARPGTASASASATLADYKIAEVGARTDSKGNPLPAGSQPYGSAVATPLPRKQIYLSGPTYSGAVSNLIDYPSNVAGALFRQPNASDTAWAAYPHASIGARLALSGKDTIVSVVFLPTSPAGTSISTNQATAGTIELVTWDGATQTISTPFKSGGTDKVFNVWEIGWLGATNSAISAASGDIDGDGKDETAFCVGNYFIILDDNLSTILYSNWVTSSGAKDDDTGDFHPSCVAAGDIKGDGTTEFVVTYGNSKAGNTGLYKVFAGSTPSVIASGSLTIGAASLSYANVAFGDIDGNGVMDLLFAGRKTDGNQCVMIVADWAGSTNQLTWFTNYYNDGQSGSGDRWGNTNALPPLVCFDPDGKINKKRDLILIWNAIESYDATAGFSSAYSAMTTTASVPSFTNVAAADINYDNKDELIALAWDRLGIDVYSLNTAGSFVHSSIPLTQAGVAPSLCVADVAGKSLTLQYVSQTVQYSNPQIIAAMASPPYYSDAASNSSIGNSSTTFGTTTGTAQSSSNSFTVSASFTLGMEAEAPLEGDAAKASAKVTIGSSFTAAFEEEKEMSYSHDYSTMAGEDAVIFSCVPFDVYTYKILSAPNAATVGTTMTVDFPRQPQIVQMERGAFNALPANTLAVKSSVMSHSLGDPHSYPSKQAIIALCTAGGGMYDPTGMTVPVGNSQLTTDTVCISQSKGTKMGTGLSIEASEEDVVLGVLFGASIGFSADFEYTVTTTDSTEISGTLPGINSSDSVFQFGIAGYNYKDTAIQTNPFFVVTYWVQ